MVSSFSNPSFPHVHAHPTRLPAMNARLSAAIDSFEALMRAALRDAIRKAMASALTAIQKAMNPALTEIRSNLAQLHRDLALGVKGDSDPASMCSKEAESIQVGHQKLHKLEMHDGDSNPLRIPSSIHDNSIPPLLSSSSLLRALATLTVKPHSNNSAAATASLPESKTGIYASTMTSAPRLLYEHSFSDTTKTGAKVVLYLSFIITTSEAIFPSLLTDNYSAFRNAKYGWINWYLVGKFVKKYLFALHLFDELPKRWRENDMAITELMTERFSNEYFPSDPSNNHSIPQTILLLQKLCRTNCGEQGRAAANTYCQLLPFQSDYNVKLIVLDRLTELKSSYREVVADMFMDVLRALSSHNLDIRRKTLDIVLSLVICTNISELVLILKREVVKTHTGELEKNGEYRQMLIQAIHSCAIKFP